jgi:hypothetical protein
MAELKLQMEDYTEAFPRRVNIEPYMHIIDAAKDAPMGKDKMPRVVVQIYDTVKELNRAANTIRHYSNLNNLNLRVSSDEQKLKMKVYRGKPMQRRTKKDVPAPPVAKTTSNEGAS